MNPTIGFILPGFTQHVMERVQSQKQVDWYSYKFILTKLNKHSPPHENLTMLLGKFTIPLSLTTIVSNHILKLPLFFFTQPSLRPSVDYCALCIVQEDVIWQK